MLDLGAEIAGPTQLGNAGHGMLRLDDELAGLMEAAEVPAESHRAHTTKPGPSVPGEASPVPRRGLLVPRKE